MGEGGAASGDGRNANLRYSWFEARVVGYDPVCLMHTVLYADGTLSVACFLLDGLAIQLHLGEVVPGEGGGHSVAGLCVGIRMRLCHGSEKVWWVKQSSPMACK